MTETLAQVGAHLTIERVAIADLREQDVNAHVMAPATFDRLVSNIKKRGQLESLPFCAHVDGRMEIVSGHHRVRAARAAGLSEIPVLVDRSGLSRSSVVAKQIAHNAIIGDDDDDILRQLIADISLPDDLLETGLDDEWLQKTLDSLDDTVHVMPTAAVEWRTISFVFLPHQLREFTALLDQLKGDESLVGVVPDDQYQAFQDAMAKFGTDIEVRSIGSVIATLTRLALDAERNAPTA